MERQRSAIIELFVNGKRQCDMMKLLNIPKERVNSYTTLSCVIVKPVVLKTDAEVDMRSL